MKVAIFTAMATCFLVGCNSHPPKRWGGDGVRGTGVDVSTDFGDYKAHASVIVSLPSETIEYQFPMVVWNSGPSAPAMPPGYLTRDNDKGRHLILFYDPANGIPIEDFYVDANEAAIVLCDLTNATYRVLDDQKWPKEIYGDHKAMQRFLQELVLNHPGAFAR